MPGGSVAHSTVKLDTIDYLPPARLQPWKQRERSIAPEAPTRQTRTSAAEGCTRHRRSTSGAGCRLRERGSSRTSRQPASDSADLLLDPRARLRLLRSIRSDRSRAMRSRPSQQKCRRVQRRSVSPSRIATAAASTRPETPSFDRMLPT